MPQASIVAIIAVRQVTSLGKGKERDGAFGDRVLYRWGRIRRADGGTSLETGRARRARARGPRPDRRPRLHRAPARRHLAGLRWHLVRPWPGPRLRARRGDGRRHLPDLE